MKSSVIYLEDRDRWRAKIWEPGQKPISKSTFLTEEDAEDWVEEQLKLIGAGDKSMMPFGAWVEEYFWPLERTRKSTQYHQKSVFRSYVLPKWGKTRLRDITLEDIERWLVKLPEIRTVKPPHNKIANSTQRQVYWLFHKMIRRAVERGWLDRSPLPERAHLPKEKPKVPFRPLSPLEISALAEEAGHYSSLIYTLAYGGMRIGEAVALRVEDLDFDNRTIAIDEGRVDVPGEGTNYADLKRNTAVRVVPMPVMVMAMLRKEVADRDARDFVFLNHDGNGILQSTFRRNTFHKAVARARLSSFLTPHKLRHTAVSAWHAEGFSIVEIARFIGDTVAVVEQTYLHLFSEDIERKMQRMDARLEEATQRDDNIIIFPGARRR